jgi:hypothetical protein
MSIDLILIISLAGLYLVTMTSLRLNDAAHHKIAYERWQQYSHILDTMAAENQKLRAENARLRKLSGDDMSEVAEILERQGG